MVFSLLKGQMKPPRLDHWNSARATLLRSEKSPKDLREGVRQRVQAQHWLTLTCFVEQIDPAALSLTPTLLNQIQEELGILRQCEPLEAYVSALDRLSAESITSSTQAEMTDVDHT